jgi:hypothetical protein
LCLALANDVDLLSLPSAVAYLTHPDLADEAQGVVSRAADRLEALAGNPGVKLAGALNDAATALRSVPDSEPTTDWTDWVAFTFEALGGEVQAECGFSTAP